MIAYTVVERLLIGGGIVTFLGVLFALALCNVASDADDRLMEGATQAETNGQWLCQVPWDRWNELGGWVTMLYPTAAVCARTERIWAQVPFADVVALLEPVVLDGAR